MRKRIIGLAAGTTVMAAVGGWWLVANHEPPQQGVALASPTTASGNVTHAESPLSSVLADATATNGDPLLTSVLVTVFDSVLSESAAPNKAAFMAVAPDLLAKHLPPELRVRALGLLERYVDMQEAMQTLTPPNPGDPAAMRHTMDARAEIRKRYFAPEELAGLFGDEMRQDAYMIDKLEIANNPKLTPEQRDQALRASEAAYLTPEQVALRQQVMSQVDVQRQTEALDARGASAQERYAERSDRYGPAAARGLADLDTETDDWNQRLDTYANSTPEVQERLRETLFSEGERMRLPGALALRAQSKQGK